VSASERFFRP